MTAAKLRLDPADEYMHPLEEATNFNESMYFNAFDPQSRLGGFFRVGNRPNEGHGEVTCCLYLPDGRVAFMYQRPEIANNDAFDAAGMRFDVVEPFKQLRVRYDGRAVLLSNPLEMADPKQAFMNNPMTKVQLDLDYRGLSPMYGGEPVRDENGTSEPAPENSFARGHYEQHVSARGQVRIGEETFELQGLGLRDHSWGPRYWQAPWWYRWLNACITPELGFMVSVIAKRDGGATIGGMVFDEGRYDTIVHASVESDWEELEGQPYHSTLVAHMRTELGRELILTGEPLARVPLRNRRKTPDGSQLVTRITETMMRYTLAGQTGYGIAEYLDQIVDGVPVGVAGERELLDEST